MRPLASTYSVLPIRVLAQSARHLGLDEHALLASAGVPRAVLDDPDGRLPRESFYAIWNEVARRSGDPAFGLHMAAQSPRGSLGVVEYVSRNARTLGDAFRAVVRYARLVHDAISLDLEVGDRDARFVLRNIVDPVGVPASLLHWTLAYIVAGGRDVTGVDWSPRAASFHQAAPPDGAEFARFFGCPVTFGAPFNELVLDRRLFDLPVRRADPHLADLLARFAEERLARLPAPESFLDRLRCAVLELLPEGAPRLPDVARLMATSARSLQRRLQEEGTSFQDVVTGVRNETAARYLGERDLGIGEIAFLLGFSEPSAFHRSFKRWSGMTPTEFRHRRASAGAA